MKILYQNYWKKWLFWNV